MLRLSGSEQARALTACQLGPLTTAPAATICLHQLSTVNRVGVLEGQPGASAERRETIRRMITLALALAVLITLLVVGLRVLQRRAVERSLPGRSPSTAIHIENYADIDVAVRMQTCPCGGRFMVRGEGPVTHAGRPLRVAHLECRRCERERSMYFDLTTLRH